LLLPPQHQTQQHVLLLQLLLHLCLMTFALPLLQSLSHRMSAQPVAAQLLPRLLTWLPLAVAASAAPHPQLHYYCLLHRSCCLLHTPQLAGWHAPRHLPH
jgi:hypothetical protein